MVGSAHDIIRKLEQEILPLQGYKAHKDAGLKIGFTPLERAFPNHTFPTGAIHDFIADNPEQLAATNGFVGALLGHLMQQGSPCVWVNGNHVFPPALSLFNVPAEQILFVRVNNPTHALWVMEEALKCDRLSAVVGHIKDLDLTQSRRLQLAVEESRVTGFIIRPQPRVAHNIACVSRWRIAPLAGTATDGLPGLGFPRWNVDLLKVRNGKPQQWQLEWTPAGFSTAAGSVIALPQIHIRNTG